MVEEETTKKVVAAGVIGAAILLPLIILGRKVGAAGEGIAQIGVITAPTEAVANQTITVDVEVKNVGTGPGGLYAYVIDRDTNTVVAQKAYTASLPVSGVAHVAWNLIMPNKNWNLRAIAGHIAA